MLILVQSVLARQPGPEIAEQLQVYQHAVQDKTRQLKSMASEVNMYRAQVEEHKYEMERVTQELNDVKKRFVHRLLQVHIYSSF